MSNTKLNYYYTKLQVLKILYDLLKEPDFREHLLRQGVAAAEAALRHAHAAEQEAQVFSRSLLLVQ